LSLAASQPKAPHLAPMPGGQKYKRVKRYIARRGLTPEDRAHAVRKACDLAVKEGQARRAFSSVGRLQSAIANSRGLLQRPPTRAEFSITMQQDPAAVGEGNAADVRELDRWR